jgi:hypothetical protein
MLLKKFFIFLIVLVLLTLILFHSNRKHNYESKLTRSISEDKKILSCPNVTPKTIVKYVEKTSNKKITTEDLANHPVIFVVGVPGSGTTLMKTILDVSPRIDCGFETKFIPEFLKMVVGKKKNLKRSRKFQSMYKTASDNAVRMFLIEIMKKNEKPENIDILCSKDPPTIDYIDYLADLFPKIKIVYMVRDGRGTAMSSMLREREEIDEKKFYEWIKFWNIINKMSYPKCKQLGDEKCHIVKYEYLVMKPAETLKSLTKFLGIEYSEDFLRHQDFKDEIAFGDNEVKKAIYISRLNTWEGQVKYDKKYLADNFEMFQKFDYKI